jgi:hypothetical protein
LVPVLGTPVKLNTVIDEGTDCDNCAVTLTLLRVAGAKARQISASPGSLFVRLTRAQVRPAPVTLVTVVLGELASSVAMNARSSSLAAEVEKTGLVMLVAAEFLFVLTFV